MSEHKATIKIGNKELETKDVKFDYQETQPDPEAIERIRQAFDYIRREHKQTMGRVATIVVEGVYDAMRPNVYHPTGPVIQGTAKVLPLEPAPDVEEREESAQQQLIQDKEQYLFENFKRAAQSPQPISEEDTK